MHSARSRAQQTYVSVCDSAIISETSPKKVSFLQLTAGDRLGGWRGRKKNLSVSPRSSAFFLPSFLSVFLAFAKVFSRPRLTGVVIIIADTHTHSHNIQKRILTRCKGHLRISTPPVTYSHRPRRMHLGFSELLRALLLTRLYTCLLLLFFQSLFFLFAFASDTKQHARYAK